MSGIDGKDCRPVLNHEDIGRHLTNDPVDILKRKEMEIVDGSNLIPSARFDLHEEALGIK
jgi:hypothetical protein